MARPPFFSAFQPLRKPPPILYEPALVLAGRMGDSVRGGEGTGGDRAAAADAAPSGAVKALGSTRGFMSSAGTPVLDVCGNGTTGCRDGDG